MNDSKKRLFLFWKIGKNVVEKQNCYENAVSKYSDLCSYYYGMSRTFCRSRIHLMKNFYLCFPIFIDDMKKLQWEHYIELLSLTDSKKRLFYFQVAIFCECSVLELKEMIIDCFYDRI